MFTEFIKDKLKIYLAEPDVISFLFFLLITAYRLRFFHNSVEKGWGRGNII